MSADAQRAVRREETLGAATAPSGIAARPQTVAQPIPLGPPLLDGLVLDYGPIDVLGRFFLAADTFARQHDIRLHFAPMTSFLEANRRNSASWKAVVGVLDPEWNTITQENGFAILGVDRRGEVVATVAARIFDWTQTSLHEEAESLRMFYSSPETMRRPGESCVVTAPMARRTVGRIAYSGGVWFHPSYRHKGLTSIMPRLSRAYAHTRFASDRTITFMAETVFEGGTWKRAGYRNVDWAIELTNMRIGSPRAALLWIDTAEMLKDLEDVSSAIGPQVDRRVYDRSA